MGRGKMSFWNTRAWAAALKSASVIFNLQPEALEIHTLVLRGLQNAGTVCCPKSWEQEAVCPTQRDAYESPTGVQQHWGSEQAAAHYS